MADRYLVTTTPLNMVHDGSRGLELGALRVASDSAASLVMQCRVRTGQLLTS